MFSSASVNWSTDKAFYATLDAEFHFTFDPAPRGGVDAFFREWNGSVFVNPPYGPKVRAWLEKGIHELQARHARVVVYLLPARTDTAWFHDLVLPVAREVRFVRGRLHFNESKNAAPFPSMVVVYGSLLQRPSRRCFPW